MAVIWRRLTFSVWMKILGLAALILGVIQGANEPSFIAGVEDLKLWLALVVALQGFFGKSNTAHGTPDAPITPEAAAQIAVVVPAAAARLAIPVPPPKGA
jgi:hypothetical protein